MPKKLAIQTLWSTLNSISSLLLVTWNSELPHEINCDVMSAGKYARHTMGCAIAGSRDVVAALGGMGGSEHRRGSCEYFPSTHIPLGVVIALLHMLERYELIRPCREFTQVIC